MDYFDSNFKNTSPEGQSDLPEGFGWDDMKEGIHEKMNVTSPSKTNKYWPLLMLLFLTGCGSGGWLALQYLSSKAPMAPSIVLKKEEKNKLVSEPQENQLEHTLNSAANLRTTKTTQTVSLADINKSNAKNEFTKSQTINSPNPPSDGPLLKNKHQDTTPKTDEKGQTQVQNKRDSEVLSSMSIVTKQPKINRLPLSLNLKNPLDGLPSLPAEQMEQKPPPHKHHFAIEKNTRPNFKKYFEFGFAGGIFNWAACDADNINHDFVSGYPGYSINPSLRLFFKSEHAFQLDYEYTNIQELFDYDGSHDIEVSKEKEIVKEVINSLTGEVISTEREDVKVPGVRSYREVKYNQYKLQTFSLGYRFEKARTDRSALGFYVGASYLFQLNTRGKRLDEQLDVFPFNKTNPLFRKNQLGLRLGFDYSFKIGRNTALFSQLIATRYVTNWEVKESTSATRPFLYGLQVGLRQKLQR